MALKFSKLTRTNIRKLQSGQKVMEHGVKFERLENGDGRWSVNIMVDSQRIHRAIGKESDGTTRKQAEDFIEQSRADARKGRLNLPKGRKVVLGFKNAAKNYLDRQQQGKDRDHKMKETRVRLHLVPFFKNKPLSKISAFDVERYKKSRLETGAAKSTINRELAVLSHLLNKSVEWGWLDHIPTKVKKLPEDKGRIVYLSTEQAARLIEEAKADQNPQIYPFIVIGLETGMRRMEILSIRLEHLDLDRRLIYIPVAKAGAREQPITAHLAEFLRGYVESAVPGQVWLFPATRSKSGHTTAIEKPFRRAVTAAGMDPKQVVRHTLRHTAISHLVQAGVDLPTVQKISGHRTIEMVLKYSHQNRDHIQTAMDKLENRYHRTG
ncbi:MAG: site-specific integrase [Magnetococcales bacterium]|nr:site-specific integrase [Magnetococcales bacterium]